MAKKKRRRRKSNATSQLMKRAKVAGWTAVFAYLKERSSYGPTMQKAPYVKAIGYDATAMLAAHFIAKNGPRQLRKPLDALATGLAGKVGYDFGANGFKVQGLGGGVMGSDSAVMGGEVDPSDFEDALED